MNCSNTTHLLSLEIRRRDLLGKAADGRMLFLAKKSGVSGSSKESQALSIESHLARSFSVHLAASAGVGGLHLGSAPSRFTDGHGLGELPSLRISHWRGDVPWSTPRK